MSPSRLTDKLWYIHTAVLFCNKKNNSQASGKPWRRLKCVSLSEVAQLKRLHTVRFQLHDILEEAKL